VCRAYVEHGMHKRRQPVKLWYSRASFATSARRPAATAVLAGRRRALGAADPAVDAEAIVLLAALLKEMDVREVRLRLSTLGSAERAASTASSSPRTYARTRRASLRKFVRGSRRILCVRSIPSTRDAEGDSERATAHRSPRRGRLEHFAAVRELLDEAGVAYELDSTLVRGSTTTREPSSSSPPTRSARRAASAAAALRPADRATRRRSDPRDGLGGGRRAHTARRCRRGRRRRRRCSRVLEPRRARRRAPARAVHRARRRGRRRAAVGAEGALRRDAFVLLADARSAGLQAQMELAGRSVKGALGHANALGARFVAIVEGSRACSAICRTAGKSSSRPRRSRMPCSRGCARSDRSAPRARLHPRVHVALAAFNSAALNAEEGAMTQLSRLSKSPWRP